MIASPSDNNDKPETLKGAFEVAMPRPTASMAVASAIEPEEVGGKGSRLRRCIVTGEVHPREEMIRFVISPEGVVTPDLEEKLPGHGYWVTCRHNELQRAVVNDSFTRAARQTVKVPPALIAGIMAQMRRSCMSTLGLARRGWQVEFGFDHVRLAINSRKAGVLLMACNAPQEVQNKLIAIRGELPVIDLFTTAELSQALGRDSLAFASVSKGQWTVRLLTECTRLSQLSLP